LVGKIAATGGHLGRLQMTTPRFLLLGNTTDGVSEKEINGKGGKGRDGGGNRAP